MVLVKLIKNFASLVAISIGTSFECHSARKVRDNSPLGITQGIAVFDSKPHFAHDAAVVLVTCWYYAVEIKHRVCSVLFFAQLQHI